MVRAFGPLWTASLLSPEPFCTFAPFDKCEGVKDFTFDFQSSCLKPPASRDRLRVWDELTYTHTHTCVRAKRLRTLHVYFKRQHSIIPLWKAQSSSLVAEIKVAPRLPPLLFNIGLTSSSTSISRRTTSPLSTATLQPADESDSASFSCDNGLRWSPQSCGDIQCSPACSGIYFSSSLVLPAGLWGERPSLLAANASGETIWKCINSYKLEGLKYKDWMGARAQRWFPCGGASWIFLFFFCLCYIFAGSAPSGSCRTFRLSEKTEQKCTSRVCCAQERLSALSVGISINIWTLLCMS